MSRSMSRSVCAFATLVTLAVAPDLPAQWIAGAGSCYCMRPVTQTYYRAVPVTEYRRVEHTVRRPVIETKYIEQPVTEYRQVVEQKIVNVPTVTYQNITEYQTVQRSYGHWATRFYQNPRLSPCQYDNRPDLFGFLNRTGYVIRQAFTPSVVASREFVPATVSETVPVTRRVAVSTTRQVSYNIARWVPITTTRRVAVNSIRYVDEKIVSLQPVTLLRNVAIGTRTSYVISPVGTASQTVLGPVPATTAPSRSATSPGGRTIEKTSLERPSRPRSSSTFDRNLHRVETLQRPLPSVVRVSGWRARRPSKPTSDVQLAGTPR